MIEGLLAGKDIYCEKPLTLTIDEGKLIRETVEKTGRILQVGTQQRSQFDLFTKAIAMVAEGRVGKIKKLTAAIGGGPTSGEIPVADAPKELDCERWLGPAPLADYRFTQHTWEDDQKRKHTSNQTNGHYEFRWWYEFSGGKLTDWGAHHVDIAMWALEMNGQSPAPLTVGGTAEHPVPFKDGNPTEHNKVQHRDQVQHQSKFRRRCGAHHPRRHGQWGDDRRRQRPYLRQPRQARRQAGRRFGRQPAAGRRD